MTTATNEPTLSHDAPSTGIAKNPIRRGPILLATDGRDQSSSAVLAAQWLAKHLDVPLDVVSVLEPMYIAGGAVEMAPAYGFELDIERRKARDTVVREYVTRVAGEPPRQVDIRLGSTAHEIAEAARATGASMIVMGAAPRRRFHHVVAGERSARVLRVADCPVLSMAPTCALPLRNIVVGVDFGPASIRAVQAALLLLGPSGTLTMLHVAQPFGEVTRLRGPSAPELSDTVQTLFGRLRDLLRPYVPDDVTIETRFATGAATDNLFETAETLRADLVAVGTQGPGLMARLVGGSVAASVLHGSALSVLAAPPPPPSEAFELRLRISGTVKSTLPHAWGSALDAFSARNVGRRAMLEIDDPDVGAQVQSQGYRLGGVTYDPHDERVEIMLGDAEHLLRHLTRSVFRPASVALSTHAAGGEEAIEIRHGKGHTLLLLLPEDRGRVATTSRSTTGGVQP